MRQVYRWLLGIAGAVAASGVMAGELRVLSAGAVEPGLVRLAAQFETLTGDKVRILFNTAPALRKRMAAGERYDVVIAPPAVMNELVKEGGAVADGRASVGRVGAGITVRAGQPKPDVGTVDAFKRALLAADTVVYNQASTGLYIERMLDRIGVGAELKAKTKRYGNGEGVLEHIIHGKGNEIGMGAIPEIRMFESKGLVYVGPLPAEVQNYTSYDAAQHAKAASPGSAQAFVRYITSPEAKKTFAATGVE